MGNGKREMGNGKWKMEAFVRTRELHHSYREIEQGAWTPGACNWDTGHGKREAGNKTWETGNGKWETFSTSAQHDCHLYKQGSAAEA